jgi:hypothetical protein
MGDKESARHRQKSGDGAYTKARALSALLFHPEPTTADGAAVNVGANSVFIVPVAVYVGNKVICPAENEGESVGGGKA